MTNQRRSLPATENIVPSSPHFDVCKDEFLAAMRKVASSVCIVATDGPGGRFGVTVSAMTSVTAEPPAVLVCVNNGNFVIPAIEKNQSFSVNLLHESQRHVSDVFAGRELGRAHV